MKYIAIDVGSSFVKACILDPDQRMIVNQHKLPQSPKLNRSGRTYEVDGNAMFAIVEQIIGDFVDQYQGQIGGILLSTQMHGFILADRMANPMTPYVSWQDERSLETAPGTGMTYLDQMMALISREEMMDTGVYLKPPLAMCNLYALLQSGFPITDDIRFCTIGSYMIFRLTGVNACHITNAGPTGFADVRHGCWSDRMIRLAGAERIFFPRLVSGFEACGVYRRHGLDIPVYPDIGDQQAGALGSLAIPDSDAIVNIGTGAQLGLIRSDFVPGPYEIRPFFDGHYLYTITRLPGGRNIDVLVQFFADIAARVCDRPVSVQSVWKAIDAGIETIESYGLEVDCSFFKTEYRDSGFISGIYFDNLTLPNLMSAVFEDIARTYEAALTKLSGSAQSVTRLVFSGGVAGRIPALRQTIMKQLGIERAIEPIDNEVFIGLYRLALHARDTKRDILSTRGDICLEDESGFHLKIGIEAGQD